MNESEKARFDAAVQAEVEKRMAEQQVLFAQMMEQAVQASLRGIDQAGAALEQERKSTDAARTAAVQEREKAEQEGEQIAQAYFERSRAALIEFTQKEQLRRLARTHLERGRSEEEVCQWLEVEPEFVQSIIEVMDRRVDYLREQAAKQRIQLDTNPRLRYENHGRSGKITFEDNQTQFDMWWEFGAGDILLFIDIPSKLAWLNDTRIPLDQRENTLRFIAEQVIQDQTSGMHGFEIGDSALLIFR